MILPSIDLQRGCAVQLRGGAEFVLDAGDPMPWLERFARTGDIAVVDLDAALGTGDNRALVHTMCARASCRVGGGIRDYDTARGMLDAGAAAIVLGTRAEPALLSRLPRGRTFAALDAHNGEIVVDGWRTRTGRSVAAAMAELQPYVRGFLVTFVEREGRLCGLDLDAVRSLRAAAGDRELVIAGGVQSAADVAALHSLGIDAQVGMALYTGRFEIADVLIALLPERPSDDLWPTVVVDERGQALGLCWSNATSLRTALAEGRGVYHSRRRGLWRKGDSSGAVQQLLRVELDCDRDALRFVVRQHGSGFCHTGAATCWGPLRGLAGLAQRVATAAGGQDAASYTRRLLADPRWLRDKLVEEADELAHAEGNDAVAAEAADVLYFTAVALQRAGIGWAAVEAELDRRANTVTRRPGRSKELRP